MVQVIESIITGYRMGEIRPLAQEPVQNSKDARRAPTAKIEYRLHERTLKDGCPSHMLTVADSGTSGLGGEILSDQQIDDRGGVLKTGEDWAAFEGQGYTKTDQDALGSRGQGKSAFLYHSNPKQGGTNQRRMVILYDTLLPNGEYRLGVRYASPRDTVWRPPYFNNEAIRRLSSDSFKIDEDLEFPLQLASLTKTGTRIIVPFLGDEAVRAFKSNELAKWLQMCWWRAIQIGEIEISLTDVDGVSKKIGVPKWWRDQFWQRDSYPERRYVAEDLPLPNNPDFKIKRVVLQHQEDLEEHQHLYDQSEPEYDGIQVIRGRQWIETHGIKNYLAFVPEEYRAGFRGFVEFERELDRELRSTNYERSQHDSYDGRKALIRDIRSTLDKCVKDFSERLEWTSDEKEDASDLEREIASRALSILVNPPTGDGGNQPGGRTWDLNLQVDYPRPDTTRVDWGEKLSRIYAEVRSNPKRDYGSVRLEILSAGPDNKHHEIATKRVDIREDGTASVEFGDMLVLQGRAKQQHMTCPEEGRYRLYAVVSDAGRELKRTSRVVYVHQDPPDPPEINPITLSVKVSNLKEPERTRINDGERVRIDVSVKNRSDEDAVLCMNASLVASELPNHLIPDIDAPESLLLARDREIKIEGIERSGEPPIIKQLIGKSVLLLTDIPDTPSAQSHLIVSPGVHHLNVDIYDDKRDERISKSVRIYFEIDPPGNASKMPFNLIREEIPDESRGVSPMWRLGQPEHADAPYPLYYSPQHHIYKIAERADRNTKRLSAGANAVIREIIADAYLDWMQEAHRNGDDSRYDTILKRPDQAENPRWTRLSEQVEAFQRMCDSSDSGPDSLAELRRETVANLVRIFEEVKV
jgi:hypothetical protein